MTRDEVARECEKLGWELRDFGEQRDPGRRRFHVIAPASPQRVGREILGWADSPRDAYLEACRREGKSPY